MKLRSLSDEETREAGASLARRLRGGETVLLYGDLGFGKTTFVKGMARAFGIPERDVISASFTIIAEYPAPSAAGGYLSLNHIDLYRLEGVDDIEGAGVFEYFGEPGAVAVVEWAERLGGDIPPGAVKVKFQLCGEGEREIIIEGLTEEREPE